MSRWKLRSAIDKANEVLATRITLIVGSIWTFYAFFIFGLTPIFWPTYELEILYWSNFLQLIFFPAITVGTTILHRDSEARAAADHETIQKEFALLKEAHDLLRVALRNIDRGVNELLEEQKDRRRQHDSGTAHRDRPHRAAGGRRSS